MENENKYKVKRPAGFPASKASYRTEVTRKCILYLQDKGTATFFEIRRALSTDFETVGDPYLRNLLSDLKREGKVQSYWNGNVRKYKIAGEDNGRR